jgi:hypothetical protein
LLRINPSDPKDIVEVTGTTLQQIGWKEVDLEDLIAENIDRVITEDDLMVISQQTSFREEPDIMACDRDGRLHMFELKRWRSSPEHLLQILRYGQRFGPADYDRLNHIWRRYQRRVGRTDDELRSAHGRYFELVEPLDRTEFNHEQRYVVITDGLDHGTRNAIEFWGAHGLPVTALPYRVYRTSEGAVLLELRRYGAEGTGFDEVRDGLVVVNTNSTYMPDVWREMIEEGKAAAYYGRKGAVKSIPSGAHVALYHTGVGFVAIGKSKDRFRRADVGMDEDEEYYVPCDWEVTVDLDSNPGHAVPAREVNEFLESSHRFRQTVYTLPSKAIDFVRKRLREKRDGESQEV